MYILVSNSNVKFGQVGLSLNNIDKINDIKTQLGVLAWLYTMPGFASVH